MASMAIEGMVTAIDARTAKKEDIQLDSNVDKAVEYILSTGAKAKLHLKWVGTNFSISGPGLCYFFVKEYEENGLALKIQTQLVDQSEGVETAELIPFMASVLAFHGKEVAGNFEQSKATVDKLCIDGEVVLKGELEDNKKDDLKDAPTSTLTIVKKWGGRTLNALPVDIAVPAQMGGEELTKFILDKAGIGKAARGTTRMFTDIEGIVEEHDKTVKDGGTVFLAKTAKDAGDLIVAFKRRRVEPIAKTVAESLESATEAASPRTPGELPIKRPASAPTPKAAAPAPAAAPVITTVAEYAQAFKFQCTANKGAVRADKAGKAPLAATYRAKASAFAAAREAFRAANGGLFQDRRGLNLTRAEVLAGVITGAATELVGIVADRTIDEA